MPNQQSETKKYWFPAKKYGWGLGFPSAWQGWVTLAIYIGSIVLNAHIFPPEGKLASFLFVTITLSALFILICWIKGEPTSWRWGKR